MILTCRNLKLLAILTVLLTIISRLCIIVMESLLSVFFNHRDALRFCFGPIIQKELDELAVAWNNHRIGIRIRQRYLTEFQTYFMPDLSGMFHCCVHCKILIT